MSKLHEDNEAVSKMWYRNILSKLSEKYGCFRNPLDHGKKTVFEWKQLQLILISFQFSRDVMSSSPGTKRSTESHLCHAPVYQGIPLEASKSQKSNEAPMS